jgi:SAM-dependent methyltransferase
MPKQQPLHSSWYDHPRLYDIAFQSDTKREADFIEAACREYCPFRARRLLEPGCGAGRLVVEMAARGYRVIGFDQNRNALDYLRRRLVRRRLQANVFEADMAEFRSPRLADAAFCTVNTFRHLLTEAAARRHLECVAESLRPGGIYVLGLHLLPPDASEEDGERWTERHAGTQVTVTLRVLTTDHRRRIERLRMNLLARNRGKEFRLREEFFFRLYSVPQFRRLLASVPALDICGVYDFWYEIDHPVELNGNCADTVFVLRKKT